MSRPAQAPSRLHLVLAFTIVVGCFGAATVYSQLVASKIDAAALEIAQGTTPSIDELAAARAELNRIPSLLAALTTEPQRGGATIADVARVRTAMDRHIEAYLELPLQSGERSFWDEVKASLHALDRATDDTLARLAVGDLAGARALLYSDVMPASDRSSRALLAAVESNANHARDLALAVEHGRQRSMWTAYLLDCVCVIVAILAAVLVGRALRREKQLATEHAQMLEQRAHELEQFAERVAHDIMNPLNAVGLAIELAGRQAADLPPALGSLDRARHGLSRVRVITDGLLDFARSGGRPSTTAYADVRATLEEVLREAAPRATAASVLLTAGPLPDGAVRCSVGVLTSMAANLIDNAIKYMGDVPERRVVMRARMEGDLVLVEVQDTGAGLSPDLHERVFEPYFRGAGTGRAGIGLGLATVRRFASAHGGRTGVRSAPGQGCTFWFELPRAQDVARAGLESPVAHAIR